MLANANVVRSVAVMVAVLGMVPRDGWTQATPSDTRLKAFIGIRTTPTRQGDVRGGTFVGDDMLPGESAHFNVALGNANDVCYSSVWASPSPPPAAIEAFAAKEVASAHYVYGFDVRTLEVMTDRIKFDLIWERTSRTVPGEVLRRTQQMTLREGESRPIDLLHGKEGTNCVSVVLEVTANIADVPRANTLEWNIWLSGTTQTMPSLRTLTSADGESVAFQFERVTTNAGQVNGKIEAVLVRVYGQLRGRVRSDGSLDVALNTNRTVGFDLSGASRPTIPRDLSTAGGSGQKNFILKPGEAVKIVLPPLGGPAPAANEMSITVQARVR